MSNNLKANVVKQLKKIKTEAEAALKLEGTITELKELPPHFSDFLVDVRNQCEVYLDVLGASTEEELIQEGLKQIKPMLDEFGRMEQAREIKKLQKKGMTNAEIAEKLGIHKSTVYRRLQGY